jgi:hypothetical protein
MKDFSEQFSSAFLRFGDGLLEQENNNSATG